MDAMTPGVARKPRPLRFDGDIGNYIALAMVNLLLTIVTIGIYRFWARTRVRRYLWENTVFDDEPLEYRGRGIEKLIGALIVLFVVFVPLSLAGVAVAALGGRGNPIAGLVYLPVYLALTYLLGVGIYRSQRYMVSRTSWRGIRGGMRRGGWRYGLSYLGLQALQAVTLGLAAPYVAVRLWNLRMNDAMFGSLAVSANARSRRLYRYFLPGWCAAVIAVAGAVAGFWFWLRPALAAIRPGGPRPAPEHMIAIFAGIYGGLFLVLLIVSLAFLAYSAALRREQFRKTQIGTMGLRLRLPARALLGFWVANALLIVLTFGLATLVMPYRVYGFYARRIETVGDFDVDQLMQTSLAAPTQGDGLADAFDVSAF